MKKIVLFVEKKQTALLIAISVLWIISFSFSYITSSYISDTTGELTYSFNFLAVDFLKYLSGEATFHFRTYFFVIPVFLTLIAIPVAFLKTKFKNIFFVVSLFCIIIQFIYMFNRTIFLYDLYIFSYPDIAFFSSCIMLLLSLLMLSPYALKIVNRITKKIKTLPPTKKQQIEELQQQVKDLQSKFDDKPQ